MTTQNADTSQEKSARIAPVSNPFNPANGRIPTAEEIRALPVDGVMYYRGSVIERVAPHALRVDGEIKNHPQSAIDFAIHNSSIGSMSNCYKKYAAALEDLLAETLAALKAAQALLDIATVGEQLECQQSEVLIDLKLAIAKAEKP